MLKVGNIRLVVPPHQNKKGRRIYDKKQYCLYYKKPYAKIARHLEGAHQTEVDVARALSLPKGSKERKRLPDCIRDKGNYARDAAVTESGKG